MRRFRNAAMLVMLLPVAAACDRMPADPLDSTEFAAVASASGERPAPLTLSGLLYASIRDVHAEHGATAALDLVRELARLQRQLDGAAPHDDLALQQELRAEQLRIVLFVRGSSVASRTADAVARRAAVVAQRREALAASGIGVPDVSGDLAAVTALLERARTVSGDAPALDAATRAGAVLDRVEMVLAAAVRLPSLVDLYADAAARLDPLTRPLADVFDRLNAEADHAVRSGSDRAQEVATAARHARINVVLAGLGPDVVMDVISSGRDRARFMKPILADAAATRDVSRLQRMNASAADMLQRADARFRDHDPAGALDLAAHAIDLLNALDAALSSQ